MSDENTGEIKFSHNWNNKLNCRCFTSIKMTDKYNLGELYKVYYKDRLIGTAKIRAINKLPISKITEAMAYIEAGMSKAELLKIIGTDIVGVNEQTIILHLTLEMLQRREFLENK
jgi:hypothetical protein